MTDQAATLYARLGGYDAIAAVADDLLPRLMSDPLLTRFWANRAADGLRREKQLLIDFLCSSAGGPLYYTGRDMTTTHKGMGITARDWDVFIAHVHETLNKFGVPARERGEVLGFIEGLKSDVVAPDPTSISPAEDPPLSVKSAVSRVP